MAEGVLVDLAAKALELLATSAFKEAASWWGARDDLKKLENSIRIIQARVRDAEKYQEEEGSEVIKEWLRRLKLVLYQADDLFDHILTVGNQKLRRKQKKQVHFGSLRSSSLFLNWKMAQEIKCIREQLDAIKSDIGGLNLRSYDHGSQHSVSELLKKRETASFVKVEDIVGRQDDKNVIIEMLFDPSYDAERVTVIPIVGFGGLGKTTLAQLVFNDESVRQHFDLTKWVCVPEVDNQKAVLGKLYGCFTDEESGSRSLNQIKSQIQDSIKNKKYLLVLDDIWDDSRDRWWDLMSLLECGRIGSKVIVTTRSDVVAKVIGTVPKAHKLGCLTDKESWDLFKRSAFKQNQEESDPNLTHIGKEIAESCGNVPLVIRVVGSLLYCKDSVNEWQLFKDEQLSKAKLMEDGNIMPMLKLSYDYLPPALKQCFAYCSLFPKDYEFSPVELVHLWMAQGYFEAPNRNIADEYFLELLRRNLFQDPEEDLEGNIKSCKMHDLVHDLAQHVAANESMMLGESSSSQISDGLVHVSLNRSEAPSSLLEARRLRSLLYVTTSAEYDGLISRFQSLRVLSLKDTWIYKVPDSIGRLVHLRYLNLNNTYIRCLPQAITRLENLQTLNLNRCKRLEELPRDFTKLPNLRHLAIAGSYYLTALPPGFGIMTSLQELDVFVVGKNNGIDSVPALNLMGNLHIKLCKWRKDAILEGQRASLKDSQRLSNLTLDWQLGREATPTSGGMNEMLMHLQLPPNLIYLQVCNYSGDEMQRRWLVGLSKIVSITISDCNNCRVLPHLSQLPHLKSLQLKRLDALEYAEDEGDIWVGGILGHTSHYFPALEDLDLIRLPRLLEWTRPSNSSGERQQQRRQLLFPRLLHMEVFLCEKLVSMPAAPKLESLKVFGGNAELLESILESPDGEEASSTPFTALKHQRIEQIKDGLISLSINSRLCRLEKVEISNCKKLRSLIIESPSSIRNLKISGISSGICNILEGDFPFIEALEIRECSERFEEEEEGKTSMYWQGLKSLRHLTLFSINNMKKFPAGIACLTKLQSLDIYDMMKLTALPEEIGNLSLLFRILINRCPELAVLPLSLQGLTSLQTLCIGDCPHLAARYGKPNGQDGHLLQHIPNLDIR